MMAKFKRFFCRCRCFQKKSLITDNSFSSSNEEDQFKDCQTEPDIDDGANDMKPIEFTPQETHPKNLMGQDIPSPSTVRLVDTDDVWDCCGPSVSSLHKVNSKYHKFKHSESSDSEVGPTPCLVMDPNCMKGVSAAPPSSFPLQMSLTVDGQRFFMLELEQPEHLRVMWILDQVLHREYAPGGTAEGINPLALKNTRTGTVHTLMDELHPLSACEDQYYAMFYSTNKQPPQFYTPKARSKERRRSSTSTVDDHEYDTPPNGTHTHSGASTPPEKTTLTHNTSKPALEFDALAILQMAPLTAMPNCEGENFFNSWAEPDASSFQVRGLKYMEDRRKIPSDQSAYILLGVELLKNTQQYTHISARSGSFVERYQQTAKDSTPFIFVINFILPFANFIAYYCPRTMGRTPYIDDEKFDNLLKRYLEGDKEFRDSRMKMIPRCVEGPWIVQTAVGQKPAIMGTKISHNYYSTDRYFELEINILSSRAAGAILGAVKNFTSAVSIDLAFVLQGEGESELPERLLGALRFYKIDVQGAVLTEDWEQR